MLYCKTYFDIDGGVVLEPGWRLPVFGWFGQVIGDTPMHFGPTLKRDDFTGRRFRQSLQANVRCQRNCHSAGTQ